MERQEPRHIQLYPLAIFQKVASLGQIVAAARALDLSPPAVSAHIREIERRYGPLFVRHRTGVRLTPNGEKVLASVTKIFSELSALECTGSESLRGTLRLVASTTPAAYLLPSIINSFCREHPNVDVDLKIAPSGACREMIESHLCDVAITGELARAGLPLEGHPGKDKIKCWKWAQDSVCLYAHFDDPILQQAAPNLDLSQTRLLVRERGSSTRDCVDILLNHRKTEFSRVIEVPSPEVIRELVVSGYGIALFSDLSIRRELETGLIRPVLPLPVRRRRQFHLLRRRDFTIPLLEKFCDALAHDDQTPRNRRSRPPEP